MKKMTPGMYTLTSAAVTIVSTALIVDYKLRKKKEKAACVGVLLAGLIGLIGGAVIAYQPEKEARKRLVVTDLLDEHDVAIVRQNITEVLGNSATDKR